MKRILAVALSAGMLVGASNVVLAAEDGHGNAENPALAQPNMGGVSGGPAHRDDPRYWESQQRRADGSPVHHRGDGHTHGHPVGPPPSR